MTKITRTFTAYDPTTGKACRIVVEGDSITDCADRFYKVLEAYGLEAGWSRVAASDCFPQFVPGNVVMIDEEPGDAFDDPADLWRLIAKYETKIEA